MVTDNYLKEVKPNKYLQENSRENNFSRVEEIAKFLFWELGKNYLNHLSKEKIEMIHVEAFPSYYFLKNGPWISSSIKCCMTCNSIIERTEKKIQIYIRLHKSKISPNLSSSIACVFAHVCLFFKPTENDYEKEHNERKENFLNFLADNYW